MVAVDILSGYLGAGKTTLLRHALQHGLDARRIAVVVNELGAVGVDGLLLDGPVGGPEMLELAGGCICCAVDAPRFDRAVVDVVERADADLLVIEASGVADPITVAGRVQRLGFRVDAITTLVDVASIEGVLRDDPVAARQIMAADFVVLTKADLVDEATRARAERRVRALNGRARRIDAEYGRVDPALLFATGVGNARRGVAAVPDPGAAGVTPVRSVTLPAPARLRRAAFEEMLAGLPSSVIRAKGVVRVDDADGYCIFNYVNGRWELSWLRIATTLPTQAVFLGPDVEGIAPELTDALDACRLDALAA